MKRLIDSLKNVNHSALRGSIEAITSRRTRVSFYPFQNLELLIEYHREKKNEWPQFTIYEKGTTRLAINNPRSTFYTCC